MVRAKFKCEAVTKLEGDQARVKLRATNQRDGDNQDWSKWTPLGEVDMLITNPPAAAQFEPGKFYYLDFQPVEA